MNFRIGHGYDVHRLVEGRALILGGVAIPHSVGLLGHSDADVLLHAIADAMLGAAAMGTSACCVPDNDPAYEGADSLMPLGQVADTICEARYSVANVDCDHPRPGSQAAPLHPRYASKYRPGDRGSIPDR